jgi:CIC family chloride channel protein
MTLDYSVVLPTALTATVSYGLRRLLLADSIYTMKLTRRNHLMPQALQANAHLVHHVSDLALSKAIVVQAGVSPTLEPRASEGIATYDVIVRDGRIVDVAASKPRVSESFTKVPYVATLANATIFDLMERMQRAGASVAVVVSDGERVARIKEGDVLGVVTKEHLLEALAEGMEIFED